MKILDLQREIERLTKWKDELQNTKDELEQQLIDTGFKEYCEENEQLTEENAELKKQVDELKLVEGKYNDLAKKYMNSMKTADYIHQQAVKDAAKEIFKILDDSRVPEDDRHYWRNAHNDCIDKCKAEMAKRYSVEVT